MLARSGRVGSANSGHHGARRQGCRQNNIAVGVSDADLSLTLVELTILVGINENRRPFDGTILHSDAELLYHGRWQITRIAT